MLILNDNLSIYCTRGDCGEISINARINGEPSVFSAGDVLRLKVFEKKGCDTVVMQRDFTIEEEADSFVISLNAADTKIGKVISKPVDYWYEVELNPDTNPQTIIGYDEDGPKVFKLFPEGKDVDGEDIAVVGPKTLQELVDYALEQAKESGDFKGEKGDPGDKGEPGDATNIGLEAGEAEGSIQQDTATAVGLHSVALGNLTFSGVAVTSVPTAELGFTMTKDETHTDGNGGYYYWFKLTDVQPYYLIPFRLCCPGYGDNDWIAIMGMYDSDNGILIEDYLTEAQASSCTLTGEEDTLHYISGLEATDIYGAYAEGAKTVSGGLGSHAEGIDTLALGDRSHAEGSRTRALGFGSHVEGVYSTTGPTSMFAHAEGGQTKALHQRAHAEGSKTTAGGYASHSEGENTATEGRASHAEGADTQATAYASHAEGSENIVSGHAAHVEGERNSASGRASHSEGADNKSTELYTHSEGAGTTASGIAAHAEGHNTTASGARSHSEGFGTKATGEASHAEGYFTAASAIATHAEGVETKASFNGAHAEGITTTASGWGCHAEGKSTTASHEASHAEGQSTRTSRIRQHVEGAYNRDESTAYHITGCGTSDTNRDNCFTSGVTAAGEKYLKIGDTMITEAQLIKLLALIG